MCTGLRTSIATHTNTHMFGMKKEWLFISSSLWHKKQTNQQTQFESSRMQTKSTIGFHFKNLIEHNSVQNLGEGRISGLHLGGSGPCIWRTLCSRWRTSWLSNQVIMRNEENRDYKDFRAPLGLCLALPWFHHLLFERLTESLPLGPTWQIMMDFYVALCILWLEVYAN